jgi:hypothetical protein
METKVRLLLLESVVLIVVSGATLAFVHYNNPYYDVDRHYYATNLPVYYLLKLCYIMMTLTLAINGRYLVTLLLKQWVTKLRLSLPKM